MDELSDAREFLQQFLRVIGKGRQVPVHLFAGHYEE